MVTGNGLVTIEDIDDLVTRKVSLNTFIKRQSNLPKIDKQEIYNLSNNASDVALVVSVTQKYKVDMVETSLRSLYNALLQGVKGVLDKKFRSNITLYIRYDPFVDLTTMVSSINWTPLGLKRVDIAANTLPLGKRQSDYDALEKAFNTDNQEIAVLLDEDILYSVSFLSILQWMNQSYGGNMSKYLTYGLFVPISRKDNILRRFEAWKFVANTTGQFYGVGFALGKVAWQILRDVWMLDTDPNNTTLYGTIRKVLRDNQIPNVVPFFPIVSHVKDPENKKRYDYIKLIDKDPFLYRERLSVHNEGDIDFSSTSYTALKDGTGIKHTLENHLILPNFS
jgi:hypothetical protein